ncbi:PTS mannitol transporter subunit IICBA [Agrococcus jejuensis]|uniref:Mannitol-specific phosphotransferase enzyme IIA component n=1 Tax=Agrococcus jejuensis TaxID=399736 RepID=A0A1G8BL79_9MICO|nr:PTS mannitol transporter subunit IICBA [Agrococcus jejuensis]SDH33975.1 PTS system D-mannitol-specific IIA component, Fru family /PTS system D-mannitol-specific IIB component, Fru family /PTS system D-mannitol-specific IIC component, Fru family [Agrococcus jejuensis]
MTATATQVEQRGGARVAVQKFGTFLSGMIMPNIPALIAWGILTALFIPDGPFPNGGITDFVVGPVIHYLLPLIIANTGGRMVYDQRGGIVATVATGGAIGGADYIASLVPDGPSSPHMFIGAMILGPLSAWVMKSLDRLWDGKIRAGFEMLVNMFSAGIVAFLMALFGFFVIAQVVTFIMRVLGGAVGFLVDSGLLPLASIIIEPAKVFFLNNALNHGVLTPLGVQQASETGQSIFFLLEANPGPGLGVLLAFTFFGVGVSRATAPGAAIIHFFGGIHEVYFPYVLAKPQLLLAMILGGASGVATNAILGTGLGFPAAPGSIIAVATAAVSVSVMNLVGVLASVVVSATVTFLVASVILRASRKRDLEREAAGADDFGAAVAQTQANKGKDSSVLSGLVGGAAAGGVATATLAGPITKIVFACDAGMGSSAMGASVLRNKIKQAGFGDVTVTNLAIANLDQSPDVIVTQKELTDRAKQRTPGAVHVSVDNFMNSPRYDEVVQLVAQSREAAPAAEAPAASAAAPATAAAADDVLTLERITVTPTALTKDAAIQEAADALVAAGAVTPAYADAMREREATVSTYMGNLLAIPHGTNEAKGEVLASAISVARYPAPISWDGNDVRFVVGIAGKDGGHLEILAKIATVFSDEAEVQRLLDAPDEQAILDILGAVNG